MSKKRTSTSISLTASLLKIVPFIRGFIVAIAIFASVISPVYAQTQAWSGVCVGGVLNENTDASDVATLQGIQCMLANIFTVIISIIGLAGFVMFIVGAFRYLTSGGNSKGTEAAKNTLQFMVIGIVVALSGFIVINLISSFTGIEVITKIFIPDSNSDYTTP
jgi:hypothetical protein